MIVLDSAVVEKEAEPVVAEVSECDDRQGDALVAARGCSHDVAVGIGGGQGFDASRHVGLPLCAPRAQPTSAVSPALYHSPALYRVVDARAGAAGLRRRGAV